MLKILFNIPQSTYSQISPYKEWCFNVVHVGYFMSIVTWLIIRNLNLVNTTGRKRKINSLYKSLSWDDDDDDDDKCVCGYLTISSRKEWWYVCVCVWGFLTISSKKEWFL